MPLGEELASRFSPVKLQPALKLLTEMSLFVYLPPLPMQVCTDPDDDKFLACAIAGKAKYVVSGDKALLNTSGYAGIVVLTPQEFVERYLKKLEE